MHRNSIWQIAFSKDAETEESEIYYFDLPSNEQVNPDVLKYGIGSVNVSELNDSDDENAIWKLAIDFASYSFVPQVASSPVEWKD